MFKIAVRNGTSAVVSRSGRKFRRKGHTNPLFLTYLLFFESPKINCWCWLATAVRLFVTIEPSIGEFNCRVGCSRQGGIRRDQRVRQGFGVGNGEHSQFLAIRSDPFSTFSAAGAFAV